MRPPQVPAQAWGDAYLLARRTELPWRHPTEPPGARSTPSCEHLVTAHRRCHRGRGCTRELIVPVLGGLEYHEPKPEQAEGLEELGALHGSRRLLALPPEGMPPDRGGHERGDRPECRQASPDSKSDPKPAEDHHRTVDPVDDRDPTWLRLPPPRRSVPAAHVRWPVAKRQPDSSCTPLLERRGPSRCLDPSAPTQATSARRACPTPARFAQASAHRARKQGRQPAAACHIATVAPRHPGLAPSRLQPRSAIVQPSMGSAGSPSSRSSRATHSSL